MDAERRRQIEQLFDTALDCPTDAREEWLAVACADDPALHAEVEALLAAHELAERLFDDGDDAGGGGRGRGFDFERAYPTRIGPYRIAGELGRGGMGTVYLGERADGQFDQRVAIKLTNVLAGRPDSDGLVRRFLAERQMVARLQHPNIVRLIDGGTTTDGRPYCVMEYVQGAPIDEHCDQRRLGVEARLRLFCAAARAVHHAHRNLIVHRDLKPSNILVTDGGEVKLVDFGIAKSLEEARAGAPATPLTRTGHHVLTPEYASPEQIKGGAITTATDVYALGLVLYELLCGHRAQRIDDGSYHAIVQAVLDSEPPRPSAAVLRGEEQPAEDDGAPSATTPDRVAAARGTTPGRLARALSGDLDRIVLRAMEKEPERRYPSAEALAADVERFLDGRPVTARGDSAAYRTRMFVRRHVWGVAAAAAFALLLGGYAATVTVQAERVRAALGQAQVEADRASQLNTLLLGLFETPRRDGEASSDSVAVRRLLQRGLARAEELNLQPEAQAQTLMTLGRVYRHLGEYGRAAPLLERALELHRKVYGDRHLNTVEARVALAEAYRNLYRVGPAEALLRQALATERSLLGPASPRVARTLTELSMVRRDAGDLAAAERLAREALEMRRRLYPGDHPDVAQGTHYLAGLLRRRGDLRQAVPLYEQALAMRQRLYRGDHVDIAESLTDIAMVHERTGDLAGAERMAAQALAMYRRLLGEDHPLVATATGNLGLIVGRRGDADSAEHLLRRALATQRHVFGDAQPQVAMAERLLALQLTRRGAYDEAATHYRASLAVLRAAFGDDNPEVALSLHGLGRVLRLQGQLAEAESYLRQALRVRRAALGEQHPLTANTMNELGALLVTRGGRDALAEAEPLLLQALEVRQRTAASPADVAESAGLLATLYGASGRTRQAEPYRLLASRK
jgi:serine/threonine-protein kinase